MSTTQEKLEAAVRRLEQYGDDIDARGATPTGEDLAGLKARMQEIKDLKAQLMAEAEAKGSISDARDFLNSLAGDAASSQKSARVALTEAGMPMDTQGKTFGELFTASPAFEDFKSRYVGRDGTIPNAVKGIQSSPFQADTKALLTGLSSTSAGALVVNDRYPSLTDLVGERELSVRDLVTPGTTTSDTVDFVRITAKTNAAAPVAEATSSAAPTTGASSGAPLTLNPGGGYKPESDLALEVVSTTVKTIAHWIPVTKRAIADAGQVRTLIDSFLTYGLNEELEDQILNGSGTGENFSGILQTAGIQTVGSAGTDIDAVVDAIRTVRVTGRRRPTALVAHPNDWYSAGFLTAKDGQGNYIIGDPRASIEQLNTLWGLKVVVTEAMTENTLLIGDFRQSVLWSREGASIMVSDQHADFFIRNLLAILGEMRAAFGTLDPQAYCTVTAV